MEADHRLSLEIDQEAGAAYLKFSDQKITRSVEFSEDILVDLDEHDVVVGIEVLDLTKSIPLDALAARFHIRTEAFAILLHALRSSTISRHIGMPSHRASSGALAIQTVKNLTIA